MLLLAALVLLWYSSGAAQVQPWCSSGAAQVQLWCSSGAALVQALVRLWCNWPMHLVEVGVRLTEGGGECCCGHLSASPRQASANQGGQRSETDASCQLFSASILLNRLLVLLVEVLLLRLLLVLLLSLV